MEDIFFIDSRESSREGEGRDWAREERGTLMWESHINYRPWRGPGLLCSGRCSIHWAAGEGCYYLFINKLISIFRPTTFYGKKKHHIYERFQNARSLTAEHMFISSLTNITNHMKAKSSFHLIFGNAWKYIHVEMT